MKILFTGDFHLDRMTAGFDRFNDVQEAIGQTVIAAEENDIDLYVFLGDLANPNNVRSHRAVATAIGVAETLRRAAIDSIWIVGNHDVIEDGSIDADGDPYSTLSPLKAAGFDVFARPISIDFNDKKSKAIRSMSIVSLPFPNSNVMYDPVEQIELRVRSNRSFIDSKLPIIVIGHLSLSGAKLGSESVEMARGRTIEWPVAAVKEHWPNAIMVGGHYHRQQTCSGVMFPGSLARLGFDEETNTPGYLILEV